MRFAANFVNFVLQASLMKLFANSTRTDLLIFSSADHVKTVLRENIHGLAIPQKMSVPNKNLHLKGQTVVCWSDVRVPASIVYLLCLICAGPSTASSQCSSNLNPLAFLWVPLGYFLDHADWYMPSLSGTLITLAVFWRKKLLGG